MPLVSLLVLALMPILNAAHGSIDVASPVAGSVYPLPAAIAAPHG